VFCTQGTLVAQMLAAKGPGAMLVLLVNIVKHVITLLHTRLLGIGCSVIMHKQDLAKLSIGGLSMNHFQPVHGYDSVTIGCNPG
jgi:hypothetical protein